MNSFIIAGNFIKRFIGSKKNLVITLLLPAVIVAFIMAQLNIPDQSTITYLNQDQGELSDYVLQDLGSKYTLKEVVSRAELNENIIKLQASAGFILPSHFSEGILSGNIESVEWLELKVSEASVSLNLALNKLLQDIQTAVLTTKSAGLQDQALKDAVHEILLLQQKQHVSATVTDHEWYISPSFRVAMGLLIMFMLLTVSSTVSLILEDRHQYTMSRMYTAPIRAHEIALGNFIGSLAIGTIQVTLILVLIHYLMGLEMKISFWSHLAITEMFLFVAIGIGTAIGSIVQSQRQLSMLMGVIIFPTCMLGGCYWPVSVMETYMQQISNFIPQKWALDAMEKLASGADITQVGLHIGVLGLFAIILLGIGSALLKPTKREAM